MQLARSLFLGVSPVLLAVPCLAQTTYWTVDDDGSAEFSTIQSAIDAAADGDVIYVHQGVYSGFTIDARRIHVVGDPGLAHVQGIVRVMNLTADQVVLLSDLDVAPPLEEPLQLTQNAGSVRLQSCRFIGPEHRAVLHPDGYLQYWEGGKVGARIANCADVFFTDCWLEGGAGESRLVHGPSDFYSYCTDGLDGADISDSTVAFYDCNLDGGEGGFLHAFGPAVAAGKGGAGAKGIASFLYLSNARILGGNGGSVGTNWWLWMEDGGDGGPGLNLGGSPSELQILDSEIDGGLGGMGGYAAYWGADGPPILGGGPSTIINLSGTRREMGVSAHWQPAGVGISSSFHGVAGDLVFLPVDRLTALAFLPLLKGCWMLPLPVTRPPAPIATIPAGGSVPVWIPTPGPTPGNDAELEFRQFCAATAAGESLAGTPVTAILVGGALPAYGCIGAPNSVGTGARISRSGTMSVTANNLVLHGTGLPSQEFGVYYYGSATMQTPFGDGFRCIGGSTHRLAIIQSDANGVAIHPVDFTQPPMSGGSGQVSPGDRWHFQFWYRDPNGPGGSGFNLSNRVSITFSQ